MNPAQALRAAAEAGVAVWVEGHKVKWRTHKQPASSLLEDLRRNKHQIIDLFNSGLDGPGGDTVDAWHEWWDRRVAQLRVRRVIPANGNSYLETMSDDAARQLAWGYAQTVWHRRHGIRYCRDNCAGCGRKVSGRALMFLTDGNAVHFDDEAGLDCLIEFGAKWRGAATAALLEMGLVPAS